MLYPAFQHLCMCLCFFICFGFVQAVSAAAVSGSLQAESVGHASDSNDSADNPISSMYLSPELGGVLKWRVVGIEVALNLRAKPTTQGKIIGHYRLGALLNNYGCSQLEERVWCQVEAMSGGDRGYVSAEYLAVAVSLDDELAGKVIPDISTSDQVNGVAIRGLIPCAVIPNHPMDYCEFDATLGASGNTWIRIKKPDGQSQTMLFSDGRLMNISGDKPGGSRDFEVYTEGDLYLIRIGRERYEISSSIVLGS